MAALDLSSTKGFKSRARHRADGAQRRPLALLSDSAKLLNMLVFTTVAFAALVLVVIPQSTGSVTYSVLTNSMAPKYVPGTFIVVKPTKLEEFSYGDVVTYQIASGRPEVQTHRIVGFGATQLGEKTLITRGDNNDRNDPEPVLEPQVRGKLFYAVPYVGHVANALGQVDRGRISVVIAPALVAYGALLVFRFTRFELRKERRAAGVQR